MTTHNPARIYAAWQNHVSPKYLTIYKDTIFCPALDYNEQAAGRAQMPFLAFKWVTTFEKLPHKMVWAGYITSFHFYLDHCTVYSIQLYSQFYICSVSILPGCLLGWYNEQTSLGSIIQVSHKQRHCSPSSTEHVLLYLWTNCKCLPYLPCHQIDCQNCKMKIYMCQNDMLREEI